MGVPCTYIMTAAGRAAPSWQQASPHAAGLDLTRTARLRGGLTTYPTAERVNVNVMPSQASLRTQSRAANRRVLVGTADVMAQLSRAGGRRARTDTASRGHLALGGRILAAPARRTLQHETGGARSAASQPPGDLSIDHRCPAPEDTRLQPPARPLDAPRALDARGPRRRGHQNPHPWGLHFENNG